MMSMLYIGGFRDAMDSLQRVSCFVDREIKCLSVFDLTFRRGEGNDRHADHVTGYRVNKKPGQSGVLSVR